LRFATVLRESGTDGNGGAFEDVVGVALGVMLLFDPVSPTEALVAPPLVSHGFGGDGDDMLACLPLRRSYTQPSSYCRKGVVSAVKFEDLRVSRG